MKQLLGSQRLHLEKRRGTAEQAIEYCKKDDEEEQVDAEGVVLVQGSRRLEGPWENGERSAGPGQRTDLLEVKRKLDEGANMERIADEHFGSFCKYQKSFEKYLQLKVKHRTEKSRVTILIGPPRTGKTRYVYDNHNRDDIFPHPPGEPWFDGYEQQPICLLDDYYGCLKWTVLLAILDRYPCLVPVKGGFTKFVSKQIFITSNAHPSKWYNSPKIDKTALYERIETYIYLGKDNIKYETDNYTQFTEFYYRMHPVEPNVENFNI